MTIPPSGFFASKAWHFTILILLGVFWGLSFSLARMSTEDAMHPISINYWACVTSAVGLVVFCALTGRPIRKEKAFLQLYFICGLLGSVIPGTLYFYAASQVSAGVLSITVATVPLTTFVGAAFFPNRKAFFVARPGRDFGDPVHRLTGPS